MSCLEFKFKKEETSLVLEQKSILEFKTEKKQKKGNLLSSRPQKIVLSSRPKKMGTSRVRDQKKKGEK